MSRFRPKTGSFRKFSEGVAHDVRIGFVPHFPLSVNICEHPCTSPFDRLKTGDARLGSFRHFARMEHCGTFRHIPAHAVNRAVNTREQTSTTVNTRQRHRDSSSSKAQALRPGLSFRSRRQRSAPLPPTFARFGSLARTTKSRIAKKPRKTAQKILQSHRILITPFARFASPARKVRDPPGSGPRTSLLSVRPTRQPRERGQN